MIGRVGVSLAAAMALGLALVSPLPAAEADDPGQLVSRVTNRLVEEAQSHTDGLRGDPDRAYRLGEELLAPLVDFPAIARRITGAHWRSASEEDREQFTREYRAFILRALVTAYVEHLDRVETYARGLSFLPTRWAADRNQAAVRSRFERDGKRPLEVEFLMHRPAGSWQVYDVTVAGVSLIGANQATFTRELANGGLGGLTSRLKERNRFLDTVQGSGPSAPPCCT